MYGDVFITGSRLVANIVGFCGPEALQQFDARMADGSIVRDGSFPKPIADLLGPILVTKDGATHDELKIDVINSALSTAHLETYAPTVVRVFEKHCTFTAALGVPFCQILSGSSSHLFAFRRRDFACQAC